MEEALTIRKLGIRALAAEDLDAVVAIDAGMSGRRRRTYFERRLEAALRKPALHAQFAIADEQGLSGYILARVMEGEFGRTAPGLRLEVIGVRRDAKGQGIGAHLFDALSDYGRRHRMVDVRTQAAWNDHPMLLWLDAMGFTLAPNHVVDCAVAGGAYAAERDDPAHARQSESATQEIDYGRKAGNDFDRLARDNVEVSAMEPGDLGDIVRIDRSITGRIRQQYIMRQLGEAMHHSALRISLTARCDGVVAGFLMARADLGDFGRVEPVAVIDTIGVDADYAHRGVGHALMSQLFANLGALRIELVETVVAAHELALLGFLHATGFRPSQRLAFVRQLN